MNFSMLVKAGAGVHGRLCLQCRFSDATALQRPLTVSSLFAEDSTYRTARTTTRLGSRTIPWSSSALSADCGRLYRQCCHHELVQWQLFSEVVCTCAVEPQVQCRYQVRSAWIHSKALGIVARPCHGYVNCMLEASLLDACMSAAVGRCLVGEAPPSPPRCVLTRTQVLGSLFLACHSIEARFVQASLLWESMHMLRVVDVV